MPAGAQCYERGPFFPTTPLHVTRLGIRRRRNLLLRPDWLVTGGLLFGAVVILCSCVTLLVSPHTQKHPADYTLTATYSTLHWDPVSKLTLDPVSWIRMARERTNQTTISLVAVGLQHGRLLVKRFEGDLTQEDSPKPASQNDTRLHSTRCFTRCNYTESSYITYIWA